MAKKPIPPTTETPPVNPPVPATKEEVPAESSGTSASQPGSIPPAATAQGATEPDQARGQTPEKTQAPTQATTSMASATPPPAGRAGSVPSRPLPSGQAPAGAGSTGPQGQASGGGGGAGSAEGTPAPDAGARQGQAAPTGSKSPPDKAKGEAATPPDRRKEEPAKGSASTTRTRPGARPAVPSEAKVPAPSEPSAKGRAEPALEPPVQPPVEPEPQSEMFEESGPEPAPAPHFAYRPSLYIVHVSPEMAPVAKVGGLADVVFGLTRELAIRGNHVEIILPKYDTLRYDHIFQMHEVYRDLWVPWYEGAIHCTVYFSFVHDRKCFFIEPHSHDNFFNRGSLYGFRDDVLRFAFFSRAAMEFMWKAGKHPDVIHCHDWQTALVPVLLYEIYQPLGMHHPRVCLTIHNFKHQGVTGAELLRATGLHRPERFMAYERLGDNHHRGALNLLKGGIVYSNFVATVSPRYAYETKDQGQGFGLEPTLHTHHMKYGGVVNGVDYDVWNPEVDTHISAHYNADTIDGKYDNKRALRHRLMLADNEKPIVAFIGRLDPQKGLELVRHGIFYSLGKGAQFVLLGSSPDHGINADFWGLKRMLNDNPDCHLEIGFDEDLSHLIYAGSDIILVPSQFEPCGLTQLIALRYGTIPVVRSVGGLADTVFDKDHSFHPLHERNGYSFETYDNQGLESALGRAIACYYEYPDHFRELMKNAMRSDYSWNHPGQDYLNIYDYIRHR